MLRNNDLPLGDLFLLDSAGTPKENFSNATDIQDNPDMNTLDEGQTWLHRAVQEHNHKTVRFLLDKIDGIDVFKRDENGMTALEYAIQSGDSKSYALLKNVIQFNSRPEAYLYAISWLNQLKVRYPDLLQINQCSEAIKIAFENHERDTQKVADYLADLIPFLSSPDRAALNKIINATLKCNSLKQTAIRKFENPIGRRAESELFSLLLLKPTKAMMEVVGQVSNQILKAIEDLEKTDQQRYIYLLLRMLKQSSHVIACGAFENLPALETIKKILSENRPDQLVEIMHIHYKFSRDIYRDIPIHCAPVREPVGKLSEIIKETWPGDPKDFFTFAISGEFNRVHRAYIADSKMYLGPLYRAENSRGRSGMLKLIFSNRLSLMLASQSEYEKDLPVLSSVWVPDCKGQDADFSSAYVKDLIENDAVYVAGFSGMASTLLGQMEILVNFEDVTLKKQYLTVIAAYIVGAGFHSLHEVIGPAEFTLNLVPGYKISIPNKNKLAEPPNYNLFFDQQSQIDPEFNERREEAWARLIAFFDNVYRPRNEHLIAPLSHQTANPHLSLWRSGDNKPTRQKEMGSRNPVREINGIHLKTTNSI